MKLPKNLFFSALGSLGLVLAATSIQAQTLPNNTTIYYWQAGSGTFDVAGNWHFKGADASVAPGISTTQSVFGYPGTPGTLGPVTVTLDPGQKISAGRSFDVMGGDFIFDLNGNANVTTVIGAKTGGTGWTIGDGTGTGPTVEFTDLTGNPNTITFSSGLFLGVNGSSGNVWGGPNATITFAPNVTAKITGVLTAISVGSTTGTNNQFNILGATQDVAGGAVLAIGQGNSINIGSGGVLTQESTGKTIGLTSGAALTVTNGGILTQTGTQGALTTDATSILTVDGTGSALSSTGILKVAGTTTISNGGTVSISGDHESNQGPLETQVIDFGDLGGNFNIVGSGSSYSNTSTTLNSDGHLGSSSLMGGSTISVTQGGSFSTTGGMTVIGITGKTTTINVDPDSTFTIEGGLGESLATGGGSIALTGGGTVLTGSLSVGQVFDTTNSVSRAAGASDVLYDTSGAQLNTGTLIWNTGGDKTVTNAYSGINGTVTVTSAINVSGEAKNATIGANTNIAIGGTVAVAGGNILVQAGGMISGVGMVNGATTNGGAFQFDGGTIRPGFDGESTGQALGFNGTLGIRSASTLQFSLFSDTSSDQLQLSSNFVLDGKSMTLKLDLVGLLSDFKLNVGDTGETFQLLTDLTGNAQGQTGADFTLDAGTLNQLAQDGFSVDTSNLDTDGTITLNESAAIPEPSTWALLILGVAGLLFFKHRPISLKTR